MCKIKSCILITLGLLSILSLSQRAQASPNKDIDLVWFDSLKPQLNQFLTYITKGEDHTEPHSREHEVSLDLNNLTEEESIIWKRLLNDDDWVANTHTLIKRLLQLRPGQKFRYMTITSEDLGKIIDIRPLRLPNCSPERLVQIKSISNRRVVNNFKKFQEYVKIYKFRQYRICWLAFELMLQDSVLNLSEQAQILSQTLFGLMPNDLSDNKFMDKNAERNIKLIEALTGLSLQNHNIKTKLIELSRDRMLMASEVKELMLNFIKEPCSSIHQLISDYVDYLDYIHPRDDPERRNLSLKKETVYWLNICRICRVLESDDLIYTRLSVRLYTVLGVTLRPTEASSMLGISQEYTSTSSRTSIERINKFYWDPELEDIDLKENKGIEEVEEPIEELKFTGFCQEMDQWNRIVFSKSTQDIGVLSKALTDLSDKYKDRKVKYADVTSDDLKKLSSIKDRKLIDCSIKRMRERWNLSNNIIFKKMEGLSKYIEHHFNRQERICWCLFEFMIWENVVDLHNDVHEMMKKLQIHKIIDLEHIEFNVFTPLVYSSLANAVWLDPKSKTLREQGEEFRLDSRRKLVDDIFKKYCYFVSDALHGLIYYFHKVATNPIRIIDIKPESRLWLAYGHICDNIMDGSLFYHIDYEIQVIVKETKGLPWIVPIYENRSTFSFDTDAGRFALVRAPKESVEEIDEQTKSSFLSKLAEETDPEILYSILKDFSTQHSGRYIDMDTIDTAEINSLLELESLRLINCTSESLTDRDNLINELKSLREYPNLLEYVKYWTRRQYNICWEIFELLIVANRGVLESKSITIMNLLEDSLGELKDNIVYRLPEDTDQFVNPIGDFTRTMATHRLNRYRREGTRFSLIDFNKELEGSVGKHCYRINDLIAGFMVYYDRFFAPQDPTGEIFIMSSETKSWFRNVRACRLLLTNENFYHKVYDNVVQRDNLIKPIENINLSKLRDVTNSTYWENERHNSLTVFSRDNYRLEPNLAGFSTQVRKKLWKSLADQNEYIGLFDVSKVLMKLIIARYSVARGHFDDPFGFEEQEHLLSVGRPRLIDCTPEYLVARGKILADPRLDEIHHLKRYVSFLKNEQDHLCLSIFKAILRGLKTNESKTGLEFMDQVFQLVLESCDKDIISFNLTIDRHCTARAIARLILESEESKKMVDEAKKNNYHIYEADIFNSMGEMFSTACKPIIEHFGDVVHYMEKVDVSDGGLYSDSANTKSTTQFVLLCSSIRLDQALRHLIYSEATKILNKKDDE